MSGPELLIALLATAALAAGVVLVLASRRQRTALHELEAYLEGWFDAKREDAERDAHGAMRTRPAWAGVYGKLAERRQAFWALRAQSEVTTLQLQRLIDVMLDDVLIYDASGRLLFASADLREMAAAELGGRGDGAADTPAEIHSVTTFLAGQADLQEFVRRGLAAPEPQPSEVAIQARGAERRYLAAAHRVPGPGGSEGLLVLLTPAEVGEELRRAGERRVVLDHVTLSAELLGHRLRNPLNSIVLLLEVLRREAARGGVPLPGSHLEGIEAEVARVEATLERFLESVRRRGRREEAVDLVTTIEAVSELLYPVAREAGLQVRQELHVPAARVRGDAAELARALLGPALAGLRGGGTGSALKFRLDSDRREHLVFVEAPGLSTVPLELAVAEELAVRNGGRLVKEHDPIRLTYRFPSEGLAPEHL